MYQVLFNRAILIQCSPLSLLGAELMIAKEYFVSWGILSEE